MGTEAIYENEEFHRILLASAGEAICVVDGDGVYRFLNAAAAESLGGRPEDLVGRSGHDFFPPDVADRRCAVVRQVIATGRDMVVDEFVPAFRGAPRWFHTSLRPLRAADGRVDAVLVVSRDVTEQKTAQLALQAAHQRLTTLEAIVDFGPAVAFRWRLEEGLPVEFVSRNVEQFGYIPEDFTSGRVSWPGIIHPEDVPRLRAEVERCAAEGVSPFNQHYRIFARNGMVRWVDDRNRFVTDADGRITHIDGVVWDVTARVEAETARLTAERQTRAVLDAPRELMILLDRSQTILWPNRAACASARMSREALIGRKCYDVWGENGSPCRGCPVIRAMETGRPQEIERKGWDDQVWYIRGYPVRDASGNIVGAVDVSHDVTDRKQAERTMIKYQQRLRCLARELSLAEERERKRLAVALHDDVCQILSATKWKLSRLKALDSVTARETWGAEVASLLDRAIYSARSLTTQLSHPALYEAGLAPAAAWLVKDIEAVHGLRVSLEAPPDPDPLDPRVRVVLFQCLRELLVNVAKHARVDQARVLVAWADGTMRVEVADNGRGFDPATLHAGADQGGFGLFSIRERVEMFGGRMNLRSTPGEGTAVSLEVPLDTAADRQGQEGHSPDPRSPIPGLQPESLTRPASARGKPPDRGSRRR
ncbi:MAG: PAS domain-containing protein [Planctomycetes bacterium]|nr:PAS domain-containing protein [Planctomycetota bacterium]